MWQFIGGLVVCQQANELFERECRLERLVDDQPDDDDGGDRKSQQEDQRPADSLEPLMKF
jgi:hypothetical protein